MVDTLIVLKREKKTTKKISCGTCITIFLVAYVHNATYKRNEREEKIKPTIEKHKFSL